MRLGVLDIGSNTGHLLVVDAHDGAAPLPAFSHKRPLRLAEHLDEDGAVGESGIEALSDFTAEALVFDHDPSDEELRTLRKRIRTDIARDAGNLLRSGTPHRAAATSKTFRSLARICGAAPSGEGALVPRTLPLESLTEWIPKLVSMRQEELADLPGVSPSRTHQIVPGALVAEACMDIFDLPALEVCPWALREGVILERLDRM